MGFQIAPDWKDAQIEFAFQKMCSRWQIDYHAVKRGDVEACMEPTGDDDWDEARHDIATLMSAFLIARTTLRDVAARNDYAAKVLVGKLAPNVNVILQRTDEEGNED
jgi:hypothetical protein